MAQKQRRDRRTRRRMSDLKLFAVMSFILLLAVMLGILLHSRTGEKRRESAVKRQDDTTRSTITTDPAAETAVHTSQAPPERWKQIGMPESALAEGALVLVNDQYSYDPSLPRTVSVYENKTGSYLVKDIYLSVTPETIDALNAWMDAFAAETGITDVNIVAGWRSFADQTAIYDNAVSTKGQAHADAYIALPGHSEHHTGLAVDLDTYDLETGLSWGFDGTGDYAWAVEHAWEYGFIQRYPPSKRGITGIDYESWHFRYVGLPHSYIMSTNNLCLEEYIDYLRGFPFDGSHLFVTCLGKEYEVYYCQGRNIVVPGAGNYTVFGNNVDGFIVTIRR